MTRLKLYQIFLICLVVGALCAVIPFIIEDHYPHLPHGYTILWQFIERLGDALLIAVVLGGFIERLIHKQEFREYALEFFVSYFGRLLPNQLQDGIKQYLEISLIRTKWKIDYDITEWLDETGHVQKGYIRLETKSEYDMQNRSEEAINYMFKYEVEDSLCPQIAETAITHIRLDKDVYETNEQLQELVKSENGYKLVHKTIEKLQPYSPIRRPTYIFKAESVECFENDFVSPFWASYPTIGTVFTIWYDKAKFDVFFDVTFGNVPKGDPVLEGGRSGTRWTIIKPILPGQGFVVRCRLKPPEPIALLNP